MRCQIMFLIKIRTVSSICRLLNKSRELFRLTRFEGHDGAKTLKCSSDGTVMANMFSFLK